MVMGEDGATQAKFIIAGLVCLMGNIVGIYGTMKFVRKLLFFNFTTDIWTLGSMTALRQTALSKATSKTAPVATSTDTNLGVVTSSTNEPSAEETNATNTLLVRIIQSQPSSLSGYICPIFFY